MDDIIITFEETKLDVNEIFTELNNMHEKLTFSVEKEENNKINYLYLGKHTHTQKRNGFIPQSRKYPNNNKQQTKTSNRNKYMDI